MSKTISPILLVFFLTRLRAMALGLKFSSLIACAIFNFVFLLTYGLLFIYFETQASETPANFATSLILGDLLILILLTIVLMLIIIINLLI